MPLELYISSLLPLLSLSEPLNSTLYKFAVDVLVIVMLASKFAACLNVSKYTFAAFTSFIEEVETNLDSSYNDELQQALWDSIHTDD